MFMGEYHHSIDEKGRIILPIKFRDDLKSEFIITRGIDSCISVYPKNTWDNVVSKLNSLSFTKKDVRSFQRFFLSAATLSTIDKQGRISISLPLIQYANLIKDCVIIGVNDHIEIWDLSKFNDYLNNNINDISSIAENLFEV